MKKIASVFCFLSFAAVPAVADQVIESPAGKVKVEFFMTEAGQPAYRAYADNKLVLKDSLLGFKFNDGTSLASGLKEVSAKRSSFNKTWEQPWGEERFVKNNYNQLSLALQEFGGAQRKLNIVFRIYDDGLGFRYEFPEKGNYG
jgi:hypothetical protein